ncbi:MULTISPECIES: hypothetical protein [unclassified Nonomuraea]
MARSIGTYAASPFEAELAALRRRVRTLEEQVETLRRELETAALQRNLTGS